MFIKKDSRKLSEIATDPSDDRRVLKLARRGPEFRGDTRGFLTAANAPSFSNTAYLSLYNNKLTTINGLSTLQGAPLADLVLSNNELTTLPVSLSALPLQRLYLEDNQLCGVVPSCVMRLTQLRVLRLSGNKFTELPESIGGMAELEELALDCNALTALPAALGGLSKLRTLLARGNKLQALPHALAGCTSLQVLAVSSNDLRELPPGLGACSQLTTLAINGNHALAHLPASLAACTALTRCTAAHCAIASLPLPLACAWAQALPPAVLASAHVLAAGQGEEGEGGDMALWEAALQQAVEEEGGEGGQGEETGAGSSSSSFLLRLLAGVSPGVAAHFLAFAPAAGLGGLAAVRPVLNLDGNPVLAAAKAAAGAREECLQELQGVVQELGGAEAAAGAEAGAREAALVRMLGRRGVL